MANNLPWLRLYTDMVDNEKIRLLAFEDRWHFVAILCCKQQGILDGNKALVHRKLAVKLGVQASELDEIKRRLCEVELIDSNFHPIGWNEHQFSSDSSKIRTRKYRENKEKKSCTVTRTSQERNRDATDTDTESDLEATTVAKSEFPLTHESLKKTQERKNKQKEREIKQKERKFSKPDLSEVAAYCSERKNHVIPEAFLDHYEANGWRVGKNPMKDWKAAVRTWERNGMNVQPGRVRDRPLPSPEYKKTLSAADRVRIANGMTPSVGSIIDAINYKREDDGK